MTGLFQVFIKKTGKAKKGRKTTMSLQILLDVVAVRANEQASGRADGWNNEEKTQSTSKAIREKKNLHVLYVVIRRVRRRGKRRRRRRRRKRAPCQNVEEKRSSFLGEKYRREWGKTERRTEKKKANLRPDWLTSYDDAMLMNSSIVDNNFLCVRFSFQHKLLTTIGVVDDDARRRRSIIIIL